jgi:3-oxoacyl-[acyl-carrier-protein] synthase-3
MTNSGIEVLGNAVRDGLPDLMTDLLTRHGISGTNISLIPHQGARNTMDHCEERIEPNRCLEPLSEFGNMASATYPVNHAHHFARIDTDDVVTSAPGAGDYLSALLLQHC